MAKPTGKPNGRPSKYTPELGEEICTAVATNVAGLVTLCKQNPHWPRFETIAEWIYKGRDDFHLRYARAKQAQADLAIAEALDIADNIGQDFIEDEDGNMRPNHEHINRSRLRIDTRKWLAGKLIPKVYGELVRNETTVTIKPEDALKALAEQD